MVEVRTTHDIFPAIKELIQVLRTHEKHQIAGRVESMFSVAWTSSTEFLEELQKRLREILNEYAGELDPLVVRQMSVISSVTDDWFEEAKTRSIHVPAPSADPKKN